MQYSWKCKNIVSAGTDVVYVCHEIVAYYEGVFYLSLEKRLELEECFCCKIFCFSRL